MIGSLFSDMGDAIRRHYTRLHRRTLGSGATMQRKEKFRPGEPH